MGYTAVIDISEHQGAFDFERARQAGIVGVIPRAGINGRRDHRFDEYVSGIRRAGLALPAVYWFANPKSTSSAHAQALCSGPPPSRSGRRSG